MAHITGLPVGDFLLVDIAEFLSTICFLRTKAPPLFREIIGLSGRQSQRFFADQVPQTPAIARRNFSREFCTA